jgi:subtilisin family serine protease
VGQVARKVAGAALLASTLLAAVLASGSARADIVARRAQRALARARASSGIVRGRPPLMHADGRIPLLVALPPGVRAADRGLLEVAPGIGAIHLPPAGLDAFLAAQPDLSPVTAPPRHTLLNVSHAWVRNRELTDDTGFDGSGVVVGIIDTGLDVTHADFRDAQGKTRVAWMMLREQPRGVHAALESQFGCNAPEQSPCAIYDAADIDALIAGNPDAAPRDPDGHGTHVTSIAAGNGGVSLGESAFAGMAPGATIIAAAPSPGGGFSDPDILNAARFIFDRADALGMPAVINISLGSDFGPHDGTSVLEKGLAALVGPGNPGRVIVLAAGNSGALYRLGDSGPFGVHTEAHVPASATTRVVLQTPGADGDLDGGGFVWVTFRPGDEVSVGLEGPGGSVWISPTDPGDESGYEDDEISAGVINNLVSEKSALTADTNGAVVFWEGKWDGAGDLAVLLEGRGDAQLWVAPTGDALPGAASLGLSFARALRAGTITVPATHPDLIAVGCALNRIRWRPLYDPNSLIEIQSFGGLEPAVEDSTCYFSAAGPLPDGGMKPEILAPGGLVAGAMSRDADPRVNPDSIFAGPGCPDPGQPCFLTDERHGLTSGTSMAAPHVSGAAALLLQAEPNLTQGQMLELLQAGARRPEGVVPYDYQMGAGALDVVGAATVLAERDAGRGPSPINSYYVLSSPYARPDLSWPVRGTIELRDSLGGVVFGVAASRIQVRLSGVELTERVVQVRAGLYRFAFAGAPGSGGATASVEVLVDGESLGARALPIGVDAWAAGSGVKPVGGCALGGGPASPSAVAWLCAAALVAARRRRAGGRAQGGKGVGQQRGRSSAQ